MYLVYYKGNMDAKEIEFPLLHKYAKRNIFA
jgi:hypothetical protein